MKSLSRDPLIQWKRMVEHNIESMQGGCNLGIISGSMNLNISNGKSKNCNLKRELAVESSDTENNQMINKVSKECTNVKTLELFDNLRAGLNVFDEKYDREYIDVHDKTLQMSIPEEKQVKRCEPDEWAWHSINLGTIGVSDSQCNIEQYAQQSKMCAFNDRNEVTECFDEINEFILSEHIFGSRDAHSERDGKSFTSESSFIEDAHVQFSYNFVDNAEDIEVKEHQINKVQNNAICCLEECSAYSKSSEICAINEHQNEDANYDNRRQEIDKLSIINYVRSDSEYSQPDKCCSSAKYLDNDTVSVRDVINSKVAQCNESLKETVQTDQGDSLGHFGGVQDDMCITNTFKSTDKVVVEPLDTNICDSELISNDVYICKCNSDCMLDLSNVDRDSCSDLQDGNKCNMHCEKDLIQDVVSSANFKTEIGLLPCREISDVTSLSASDEEGSSINILAIKITDVSTNYNDKAYTISSAPQTSHIPEMIKGTDPVHVDSTYCTAQNVFCSTNPHGVQDDLLSSAADIQGRLTSVIDLGSGDGFLEKNSFIINRGMCAVGLSVLSCKEPRQMRTHKSTSVESILARDRSRTRKCDINSVKCESFDRISYVDIIDIGKIIPKYVKIPETACNEMKRGSIKRDDCDSLHMQCFKHASAENSAAQASKLNHCHSKCDTAPEQESNRTLKHLTRNPMTQWKRLVDANLDSVISMKTSKIDRAKLGGGDIETCILNKTEAKVLIQNAQELESSVENVSCLKMAENDIEKLSLLHDDVKTDTCDMQYCVTNFNDVGHFEDTRLSVMYEHCESIKTKTIDGMSMCEPVKTKTVDNMSLVNLEVDASVEPLPSDLPDSGYSEFDEEGATCSGLECQSLTEQISELAADKSTESIRVSVEFPSHVIGCQTEIEKIVLNGDDLYSNVAEAVCNLNCCENSITPVTSVNFSSSKINTTDDTHVVNAENDFACYLSNSIFHSDNGEENSVFMSIPSSKLSKDFPTELDKCKGTFDLPRENIFNQSIVNEMHDLDQTNCCHQDIQMIIQESDSSCEVDKIANKFDMSFYSDYSEQMSYTASIGVRIAENGDKWNSQTNVQTDHSGDNTFQSSCSSLKVLGKDGDKSVSQQQVQSESDLSQWEKIEDNICNLNNPSNHTSVKDIVRTEYDINGQNEVFKAGNKVIPVRFSLCHDQISSDKYMLVDPEMKNKTIEVLDELLIPEDRSDESAGKVIHAFIANIEGEMLAKTADLAVTKSDIKSLIYSLTSSYRGMMKISVFNDVYTCFKHDQNSSLIGNADSGIFVAHLGKESIVVGFSDPRTPGSCIKEMHDISHLLDNRGL